MSLCLKGVDSQKSIGSVSFWSKDFVKKTGYQEMEQWIKLVKTGDTVSDFFTGRWGQDQDAEYKIKLKLQLTSKEDVSKRPKDEKQCKSQSRPTRMNFR